MRRRGRGERIEQKKTRERERGAARARVRITRYYAATRKCRIDFNVSTRRDADSRRRKARSAITVSRRCSRISIETRV